MKLTKFDVSANPYNYFSENFDHNEKGFLIHDNDITNISRIPRDNELHVFAYKLNRYEEKFTITYESFVELMINIIGSYEFIFLFFSIVI